MSNLLQRLAAWTEHHWVEKEKAQSDEARPMQSIGAGQLDDITQVWARRGVRFPRGNDLPGFPYG